MRLKTLKDIEGFGNKDRRIERGMLIIEDRERIKQEAIKWVKYYGNLKGDFNKGVAKGIQLLHNITESDLEDGQ